jgi:periplasmic protein TonB
MRIGFFLLLSLALHLTVLNYPVFFSAPRNPELLPVVVLGLEDRGEGDGGGGGGSEESNRRQGFSKRGERIERQVGTNGVINPEQRENQNDVAGDFTAISITSEGIAVASNQSGETEQPAGSSGSARLAEEVGYGSGNARFSAGTGYSTGGTGYGKGNGTGSGNTTVKRVGVSYAYSPKPEYPDSARREGREGTVILSVLVDEEGRSKSLELNHSSGFEALDRAALNTVRHWRFNAARYGDQRVESWVKIPIVFRLADSRD